MKKRQKVQPAILLIIEDHCDNSGFIRKIKGNIEIIVASTTASVLPKFDQNRTNLALVIIDASFGAKKKIPEILARAFRGSSFFRPIIQLVSEEEDKLLPLSSPFDECWTKDETLEYYLPVAWLWLAALERFQGNDRHLCEANMGLPGILRVRLERISEIFQPAKISQGSLFEEEGQA